MSIFGMPRLSFAIGCALSAITASAALAQQKPPPFAWVVAENGQLPRGALAAGNENNQPTAACRILVQGALYAGRVANGACRAGLMGREIADKRYEVLVAEPRAVVWLHSAQIDRLPPGAIAGGYEPGPRVNILCRTQLPIGMVPGRFAGKGCIVSNANGEVTMSSFEVAALAQPPSGAMTLRSSPSASDATSDGFAKNARAVVAAMQAELAGAGLRSDDPLNGHVQRLDASLAEVATLAPAAAQSLSPTFTQVAPPPAARVVPFFQAMQNAQQILEQMKSALGAQTSPASQLLLALIAKQQADLTALREPVKTN